MRQYDKEVLKDREVVLNGKELLDALPEDDELDNEQCLLHPRER